MKTALARSGHGMAGMVLAAALAAGVTGTAHAKKRQRTAVPPLPVWRALYLEHGERASPRATRVDSCELQGRIDWAGIFSDEQAGRPLLELHAADLASLRPGITRASRLPVRVEWPVMLEGWIEPGVLAFRLLERCEVQKGHVWLAPGARVSAFAERDGSVAVVRPGSRSGVGPTDSGAYETRVPCDKLAIGGGDAATPAETPGKPGFVHAGLRVHSQPAGPLVAAFPAQEPAPGRKQSSAVEVGILGQKDGWMHVRGHLSATTPRDPAYLPFDFDGWTRDPVSSKPGRDPVSGKPGRDPVSGKPGRDPVSGKPGRDPVSGKPGREPLEVAKPAGQATHVSVEPIPLRLAPNRSAPVLGRVAKDVPMLVGRRVRGFSAVKLPGVALVQQEGDLWIPTAALRSAARALAPR